MREIKHLIADDVEGGNNVLWIALDAGKKVAPERFDGFHAAELQQCLRNRAKL